MYVKQQNERQKILLSGQFQGPKAQHHRKTKNTTVGTGSKIQKNIIIERQKYYCQDRFQNPKEQNHRKRQNRNL
jgi:hypothetical protein